MPVQAMRAIGCSNSCYARTPLLGKSLGNDLELGFAWHAWVICARQGAQAADMPAGG
ncbi:hypothetical protein [Gordonibacter sp. Marseille-P4307]|uniref:hypothetical protein n=1 Tax=Gordonibacter sp. Marseille-P4307 TaxID=2161815 RepID=UPI0013DE6EDA|nr:hypothetical protein [Gordonibacter sp. Marseille-P4307]